MAVSKQSEPMQLKEIDDPLRDTVKLRDLEEETAYILYAWARTAVGRGEEERIEDQTIAAGSKSHPRRWPNAWLMLDLHSSEKWYMRPFIP